MATKHSKWYDAYYRDAEFAMGPWHRFALPEIISTVTHSSKILEFGCGQGHVLRFLAKHRLVPEENITAVEQSEAAANYVKKFLPRANIQIGDIYDYKGSDSLFDVCLLFETIEHLEYPDRVLRNIHKLLSDEGKLFISFPNFLHLPWLAVRILAEKLNRPNWIVLQPVDKIYTVFSVIKLVRSFGFNFVKGIGSNYGPPVLYPLETELITKTMNALGLWRLSFHPILVFQKQPV